jgi:hypothetical protein
MLQLVLGATLVLLLLQGWLWYVNRFEGPRTKQRQQQRQPLLGLAAWGFVPIADACVLDEEARRVPLAYLGQVEGCSVEVAYHWQSGWNHRPYYRIRAFFEPAAAASAGPASPQTRATRSLPFQANENWHLAGQYAKVRVPIGKFTHPDAAQLWQAARQLLKELGRLHLLPLDYREACRRLDSRRSAGE